MNTEYTGWLYPVYNIVMLWSVNIADWSGAKSAPWQKDK